MKTKILIFILVFSLCFLCIVIPSFAEDDISTSSVTNLTGSTWEIPIGWSASSGYGIFSVDYSIERNSNGYVYNCDELYLGYRSTSTTTADALYCSPVDIYCHNQMNLLITFTGGTDVSNSNLISWLVTYGTMTVPPTPPTDIISSGYRYQSFPPSSQLPPIPIPPDPSFLSVGVPYSYEAVGTYYLSNHLPYVFTHASWELISYTDSSNYTLHFDVQRETGTWVTLYSFVVQSGSQTVVPFNELSYFVFANDFEVPIDWFNLFYSHFAPQLDTDDPSDFTDNPWLYILEMVVDALHYPLWGYFSPWDIFTTVSGIFIVTWLLKLIAGG